MQPKKQLNYQLTAIRPGHYVRIVAGKFKGWCGIIIEGPLRDCYMVRTDAGRVIIIEGRTNLERIG